jgi:hypothetical protein
MPELQHAIATHSRTNHYARLLVMMVLSFMAMYALMYTMVNNAVASAEPAARHGTTALWEMGSIHSPNGGND